MGVRFCLELTLLSERIKYFLEKVKFLPFSLATT